MVRKLNPGLKVFLFCVPVFLLLGLFASLWDARNPRPSLVPQRVATLSEKFAEKRALYATWDPRALPKGSIELVKGRRILLLENGKVRSLGEESPEATLPMLAREPGQEGLVLSIQAQAEPVKAPQGVDAPTLAYTRYRIDAIAIPERQVVAFSEFHSSQLEDGGMPQRRGRLLQMEAPEALFLNFCSSLFRGELPKGFTNQRWLWMQLGDQDYLVYFYYDRAAGPSAKGGPVSDPPKKKELTTLLDKPGQTFRDPLGHFAAVPLSAAEISELKLPERPSWLHFFERAE